MHRQQGKSGFMDATPIAADVQLGFIIQQCTMVLPKVIYKCCSCFQRLLCFAVTLLNFPHTVHMNMSRFKILCSG